MADAKFDTKYKYIGWSSFMEELHDGEKYVLCIPLPFVMAKATDQDTISTVVNETHLKCIQQKQQNIFITFDLPWYIKAIRN